MAFEPTDFTILPARVLNAFHCLHASIETTTPWVCLVGASDFGAFFFVTFALAAGVSAFLGTCPSALAALERVTLTIVEL